MQEFRFINLFRALAAYWVLAEHCQIWAGWQSAWMPHAKMAVDIFMVISGYLMAAHAIEREGVEPLGGRPGWWRNWLGFWTRRYFRIAPLYYLCLLIVFTGGAYYTHGFQVWRDLSPARWDWVGSEVYAPSRIVYSGENLAWHLSFLFGLHPQWSFSTFLPDWSLSLEMQFYVVFPALWVAVRRWGAARTTLWLGIPVFLFSRWLAMEVFYYEPSLLVFGLNYFLAGMAACCAIALPAGRAERRLLAVAAVLLAALDIRHDGQMVLLPLLTATMLALAWLESRRRMPRALAALLDARLVHLGSDLSYGVYLFHGLFIAAAGCWVETRPELQALAPRTRALLLTAFVTLGSYAWAWLVHRAVEKPGIRLGRGFLGRLRTTPARVTAS